MASIMTGIQPPRVPDKVVPLVALAGWTGPAMSSKYGASAAAQRATNHYDQVTGKPQPTG
jgi:hypothetical protein